MVPTGNARCVINRNALPGCLSSLLTLMPTSQIRFIATSKPVIIVLLKRRSSSPPGLANVESLLSLIISENAGMIRCRRGCPSGLRTPFAQKATRVQKSAIGSEERYRIMVTERKVACESGVNRRAAGESTRSLRDSRSGVARSKRSTGSTPVAAMQRTTDGRE